MQGEGAGQGHTDERSKNGLPHLEPLSLAEEEAVQDIRRTVTTWMQRIGVRFEVTEAVLNHVSGARGRVAGVY